MIYSRNYRSIFPLRPSEFRRLALHIEEHPNGCWLWTASTCAGGYGRVYLRNAVWQVHKMVYEIFVGPVPEGYVLHHRCKNKRCCNPAHLKLVTQGENLELDGVLVTRTPPNPLRTWCKNGHELTDDNVRWRTVHGKRWRVCRLCEAATRARRNERRRAQRAARRLSADGSSHPQAGG